MTLRRSMMAVSIAASMLVGALAGVEVLAQEDRVLTLPEDYRTSFTRYYSGDRVFNEDQAITIYANAIARDGAQKDGTLPFGSVLIAELHTVETDADGAIVESAVGRRIPTGLKAIAVMERQAGWDEQYPDDLKVGDWEFELFSAAGENLGKDMTACRECHHPLTDSEFIFTLEHLAAAN